MKNKRGFTMIELIVVIGILLVLATLVVYAYRTSAGGDRMRSAGRIAQSAFLGAKDRAAHAKEYRGVRLLRDSGANLVNGFAYIAPIAPQRYGKGAVYVEHLDLRGSDGIVDTARIHGVGPSIDWQSLEANSFFSTPRKLRYPALSQPTPMGQWESWANLQVAGPNHWTVDTYYPKSQLPGIVVAPSDPNASVEFEMRYELLHHHQPIQLPSGVVIDIAFSSTNIQTLFAASTETDIVFNPGGTITGPVSVQGPIHLLLRDIQDATQGLSPISPNCKGESRVLSVFPQTGHVQVYELDPTDADANGYADDPFRFAKQGSRAGN